MAINQFFYLLRLDVALQFHIKKIVGFVVH